MVRNILLVVVFFASFCFDGQSQSTPSDAVSAESKEQAEVTEEVVDGFWSVTAYFGKKLVDGMSERLNLDDEETKEKAPKKKVTLRLGSFEVQRIEGG